MIPLLVAHHQTGLDGFELLLEHPWCRVAAALVGLAIVLQLASCVVMEANRRRKSPRPPREA